MRTLLHAAGSMTILRLDGLGFRGRGFDGEFKLSVKLVATCINCGDQSLPNKSKTRVQGPICFGFTGRTEHVKLGGFAILCFTCTYGLRLF